MEKDESPTGVERMLDRIEQVAQDGTVSLDQVLSAVGRSSFGPILLLTGLIVLLPIVGDIPGMPTTMALIVLLTSCQLLFRRKHIWLPHWLLKRSIDARTLRKGLGWMIRPARFVDRHTHRRLAALTTRRGAYAVAVACCLIAVAMPAMELVPFSANGAGAALAAFGLALIANDGVLALIAFLFTAGTVSMVIYSLA
jgi:hypothetical protein